MGHLLGLTVIAALLSVGSLQLIEPLAEKVELAPVTANPIQKPSNQTIQKPSNQTIQKPSNQTLAEKVELAPVTANPIQKPSNQPIQKPSNQRCWTEWFDRDDPSGTGDWELLVILRDENPGKICEKPMDIEAMTLSGLTPAAAGDVVTMDKDTGLFCKNKDQKDKQCNDYRVRFSCYSPFCAKEEVCWTDWLDRDNPSGTGDWELLSDLQKENPGKICNKPKYIEAVTVSGNIPAIFTGQEFIFYSPTEGFVCKNVKGKQYCKDYKVRFGCCC